MTEDTRLIEVAFPIRQVSLDSVHEKNVRHGHISTLHLWPARRPLAASRAVILATLLPDPGSTEERRRLLSQIAGQVVEVTDAEGKAREETEGGVLRWGRETSPNMELFKQDIRNANRGQTPRVLDPFAGGGAIPLEAMRLGCHVAAADLNPVSWFVLRCTLYYPQLLKERQSLPQFITRNREFMTKFLQAKGIKKASSVNEVLAHFGNVRDRQSQLSIDGVDVSPDIAKADFDWHLRAWGEHILESVRRALSDRYPTYAEFEPPKGQRRRKREERPHDDFTPRLPRILEADQNGSVNADKLNSEFSPTYLNNRANPRWVVKRTVAYLWARTSRCANCRAEIPLLKTCWLCKRDRKRVLLKMVPQHDRNAITFEIDMDVPLGGSNTAQRREYDKEIDCGTMSRSGATCPLCGSIATLKDLRARGQSGLLGERIVAVVVNGQSGKEYRLPRPEEITAANVAQKDLDEIYGNVPFGLPNELTPKSGSGAARAFSVHGYGLDVWRKLFTNRQLLMIGMFIQNIRQIKKLTHDYPDDWSEAIIAYCAVCLDRLIDYSSAICTWHKGLEKMRNTFARFALPMVWDFAECNPLSDSTGNFSGAVEWVGRFISHAMQIGDLDCPPVVSTKSAIQASGKYELIVTDPPYYDAIPYSDLMDFFYVWTRRTLTGMSPQLEQQFRRCLGPKWDSVECDGELIDDANRFGGDRLASKSNYEEGMGKAFSRFYQVLEDSGRLVIVFANKQPDAWETLVSALVRAGFVVTASWPIQTEMQNRQRSLASAALSSSIWLVCRKRPPTASAGWDGPVLREMQHNINRRTHDFWDAGIRGPDFIWAATGPALEAFSQHPVVKKANSPGERLTVTEFLGRVRRMVVAFIISQLLAGDRVSDELDDLTTYYLLHRRDFGLGAAPAGACILYALSCNLSDSRLAGRADLLVRSGQAESASGDVSGAVAGGSGGGFRLKAWARRVGRDLGEPSADCHAPPLVDCLHKLMRLWRSGEQSDVDAYLDARGLWDSEIFSRVVQAIIELADRNSEERSVLETIQNHIQGHHHRRVLIQRPLV